MCSCERKRNVENFVYSHEWNTIEKILQILDSIAFVITRWHRVDLQWIKRKHSPEELQSIELNEQTSSHNRTATSLSLLRVCRQFIQIHYFGYSALIFPTFRFFFFYGCSGRSNKNRNKLGTAIAQLCGIVLLVFALCEHFQRQLQLGEWSGSVFVFLPSSNGFFGFTN